MPEKEVFKSRFLKSLFFITLFFLILSLFLLFRFSNTSWINTPSYNLILLDNTENTDPIQLKSIPFPPSPDSCNPNQALLKVFMYDLPPEFHFGLLGWKGKSNQIWPNVSNFSEIPSYPGGLNLQHSVEYWLTLDLLSSSSTTPNIHRPCTAILVQNSTLADIIFVPFFSSLSYNRHARVYVKGKKDMNMILQEKLVKFLKGRDEWKRFGGKDHLVIAHHPNSMLLARKHLSSSMVLLSDFGRYPVQIANIDKDLIAPYKHVVKSINASNSLDFEERTTLVYFRGAIYRKDGGVIRQELYYIMKDEKDVYFSFGSAQQGGIRTSSVGMATSKFCLNIAGDTPSSNRLFDAIATHCVPVIISDEIELPYEDVLDYSKFSIFVHSSDACKKGYLLNLLKGIKKQKWRQMWERLKQIAPHFEYQYPSRHGDAVDMIWQSVSRKVSFVNNQTYRKNRYRMSQEFLKSR
ncbi:probable arabinosyltransferase ARAD1 [Lactuca sativa]|uniref:Exostosin GT47 domain-containing protein n=1 Tax=Lactuca sativa TaxID=4236 RepID=A0A9R1XBG1_LACSA|nr:probable arabinosyltransferase ARAD1 [Lactuca sativa]KAJ0206496.1 hypothetical protein LSAT_V11C500236070 [Lactuca sativa]